MIAAVAFLFCLVALTDGVPLNEQQSQEKQGPLCLDPECVIASGDILDAMDQTADPCTDFYRYVCGGWLDQTDIPPWSSSVYKSFGELSISNLKLINKILEANDSTVRESDALLKAKAYYSSCMDVEYIEALGAAPLIELLEQFGGWDLVDNQYADDDILTTEAFTDTITNTLNAVQNPSNTHLFHMSVDIDDKNSSRYIIFINQPHLWLGPQNLYLGDYEDLLNQYLEYGVKIAVLYANDIGIDILMNFLEPTLQKMKDIIELEKKLAEIMVPMSELRDPFKTYHKMTLKDFSEMIPVIDIFSDMNNTFGKEISPDEEVLVPTKSFFPKLNELIMKGVSKRTMTNYVKWRLVTPLVHTLPTRYRKAELGFRRFITGIEADAPRWLTCTRSTESIMGFVTGAEFVKERKSLRTKDEIEAMIENVRQTFLDSLPTVDWMDKTTESLAVEKAKAITDKLVSPSWIMDNNKLSEYYDKLIIDPQLFFVNVLYAAKFYRDKNRARLHTPVDKMEWGMVPATVNAYYSPQFNQIVFPAGILHTPFYAHIMPMSINYGNIGWVIGHEITHGFDNNGRKYDDVGNLHNWWKNSSAKAYIERAQCIQDQYNGYKVGNKGLHDVRSWRYTSMVRSPSGCQITFSLTAIRQAFGQNLARLNYIMGGRRVNTGGEHCRQRGIRLSLHAYQMYRKQQKEPEKRLPGLQDMTPEQLFFISAGQTWCSLNTPEAFEMSLLQSSHSPGKFRVIGTFSNTDEFSEAFDCPPQSVMNPDKKCRVW